MRNHSLAIPFIISLFLILSVACNPETAFRNLSPKERAQQIIDSSITAHGGERFASMKMSFDFRNRQYTIRKQGGLFEFTRSFEVEGNKKFRDVLDNYGFTRIVNGDTVNLPDERIKAFSSSVGSVIYFALLPYGLNDSAVQKQYIGTRKVRGIAYFKIKVSFEADGGGSDHEDNYVYWINPEDYMVDYLAYDFITGNGERGMRFREAYQVIYVNGVLVNNYINYKPVNSEVDILTVDSLFEAGALMEVSRINLENITVQPL